MKRSFATARVGSALLLAALICCATFSAHGEGWNSWMPQGARSKNAFEAQLSLARLSERHGQADTAEKIYSAVLTKDSKNQLAHHRLAVMAAKKGDFETANRHFDAAITTKPVGAELLSDIGYALYLQDRLDEAEESLRYTLSQFSGHKPAHNTLGIVLGQLGRYDEALDEFRQAVDEAEAQSNLAFVLAQSGETAAASQRYHHALSLNNRLRPAAEALLQLHGQAPTQQATQTPANSASRAPSVPSKTAATVRSRAASQTQAATPKIIDTSLTRDDAAQQLDYANLQAPEADAEIDRQATQASRNVPQIQMPAAPQLPASVEAALAPRVAGLPLHDQLTPAQAHPSPAEIAAQALASAAEEANHSETDAQPTDATLIVAEIEPRRSPKVYDTTIAASPAVEIATATTTVEEPPIIDVGLLAVEIGAADREPLTFDETRARAIALAKAQADQNMQQALESSGSSDAAIRPLPPPEDSSATLEEPRQVQLAGFEVAPIYQPPVAAVAPVAIPAWKKTGNRGSSRPFWTRCPLECCSFQNVTPTAIYAAGGTTAAICLLGGVWICCRTGRRPAAKSAVGVAADAEICIAEVVREEEESYTYLERRINDAFARHRSRQHMGR